MKVLIADDNPTFRTTLKRVLSSKPNVDEVWEAKDGEEAVRLAREVRPDLILIDLAMPRIDGLEATRLIKDHQPFIRIIVVSVHDEPIYHQAASACGADLFLPKSQCVAELESAGTLQRIQPKRGDHEGLEAIGTLKGAEPRWIDPKGE
jgi:DNA-binding NarL/FixJ family response regulator